MMRRQRGRAAAAAVRTGVVDIVFDPPAPYQREAMFGRHKYALVEASTKTGKTVFAFAWLFTLMVNGPRHGIYWWVAPSHRAARMVYERAKVWFAPLLEAGLMRKHDSGPRRLTIISTGAFIEFFSTDDTDALYGDEPDGVVVDEASRHRTASLDALESVILPKDAPVRYIGNVKNKQCWFWHMCRAVEAAQLAGTAETMWPGWYWVRWTIWDAVEAGIHARIAVERKRDQLRARGAYAVWLRDYEATLDGVNVAFDENHYAALRVAPPVEYGRVILGIDPGGKRHPAGLLAVRARVDEESMFELEVIHAEHWRGNPARLPGRVSELIRDLAPHHLVCDRAMPLLADMLLERFGRDRVTAQSWKDDKRWAHFESTRSLIAAERVRVEPGREDLELLVQDMEHVAIDEENSDRVILEEYRVDDIEDGREVKRVVHCDTFEALMRAVSALPAALGTAEFGEMHAGGVDVDDDANFHLETELDGYE